MPRYEAGINSMNPSPFKDLLVGFYEKSNAESDKLKQLLENWFNDYQERVTGWYKKKQRNKGLFVGMLVAIMLNVDSLHLIKVLSLDEKLRANLVQEAEMVADNYEKLSKDQKENTSSMIATFRKDSLLNREIDSISSKNNDLILSKVSILTDYLNNRDSILFASAIKKILFNDSISKEMIRNSDEIRGIAASLNIPIGYSNNSAPLSWFNNFEPRKENSIVKNADNGLLAYNMRRNEGKDFLWAKYLLGIIISGVSLSFGAPFWFELLVKLVNIRRSGIKPEVKKETK